MAAKRKRNNQTKPFHGFGNQSDANKRPKQQDPYCWLCHRNTTNVNCVTCIRSYHHECIGLRPQSLQYQCETCKRLNLANSCTVAKFGTVEHLNRLLVLTTKRLLDDQEFNGFKQNYYDNHGKTIEGCSIVNPIHLDIINGKVHNSEYESTFGFLNDIKWICHNINIMDDPDNKSSLRCAKRLEKFCMKEIYDVEMCHQCYFKSNTQKNWFTAVCNPPHLLVWAQVNSSGYAPAKVLGLNGNTATKKVDVRFFADHEMALVPTANCYIFSKRIPSEKFYEQTKFKRTTALQEVGIYVGNIRQIFPDFTNAEYRTPFDERKVVKHLMDMFPGIRIPRDYQLLTKPKYLNRLCRRHAPIALQPNDDDNNSSSHGDRNTSPTQEPTVLTPSSSSLLSPAIILEKCDPLLTTQQQTVSLEYPINGGTAEIINSASHEQNNDGRSEGEADMILEEDIDRSSNDCWQLPLTEGGTSYGQSSTTLFTVPVTPMHLSTYDIMQNKISAVNGQDIAIARKKSALLVHSFGTASVSAMNNAENPTSTPMQSFHFQTTNESQHVATFSGTTNQLNRITNFTEISEVTRTCMNLPLSTVSEPSGSTTMNCDWEQLLDKYQSRMGARQRINRKFILNRERVHQMKVNQLKSTVNALKKQNRKLRMSVQKMDGQRNERLLSMVQNAIEETKRKKWCWICRTELKHVAFNIPMCKDCVHRNWFGNGENLDESEEAEVQNENTSGFQNIVFVEQSILNEHQTQQSNTVDQLLADLNVDDPLSFELELGGF